ncbi:hypothetical protein K457DRAFT_32111 [Linnemannia elongata AG-77]|uniref:Transmembrane protein n=1 Tax=Linnemannia elongata AG-77 TaxID=1314771 RepID=A0A197JWU2_9FUNG|nr:hypothetical protein K457DRAFT_32111 [Linnemannia elongata AG-77]
MSTTHVQPKSSPRELSKRMFFLAGYSLTGAALMGSSIGLVIYQSRQFYFLHRFSRSDEMHPHHHHGRFHDFNNNQTFEGQNQGWNNNSNGNDPSTHGHYPHPRFHGGGHGHHRSLQSLFFSTWLPILVWFFSLLTSSLLIATRKWLPRAMSARTGVLVSQCVFALFWILLGAMQEVQERLIAERRAARMMGMDPIAAAMEDSSQFDTMFELKEQIQSMIMPLGTVWYLTVILLGSATGLLTASSSLLEKQLQEEFDEAVYEQEEEEEEEEEAAVLLTAEEKEALMMNDTKQSLSTLTQRQDSRRHNFGSLSRYTNPQRVQLGLLMFFLFMTQMKLFQWIIQARSMQAFIDGTSTSVSLTLTLVGLVSGTVMTCLGVRFLPRTAPSSSA